MGKKKREFVVRQLGRIYNKYCYYSGFNGDKYTWTKNLRNACRLSAEEAFKIKDCLKLNHPRVVGIFTNSLEIIKGTFKVTRAKYLTKEL